MKTTKITIYQRENKTRENTLPQGFTTKYEITSGDVETLAKAVSYDNCLAEYKNGYKIGDNFIKADCILADIDNAHSENEEDWITHDDVIKALPNVEFYYYPSRNHMKQKGDQKPRPKEHYIFPTDVLSTLKEYTDLMHQLIDRFPNLHFDKAVSGKAQLNFGVENVIVGYNCGEQNLSMYMKSHDVTSKVVCDVKADVKSEIIPKGERNNTLYRYACKVLYRDGDTQTAYEDYINETRKCKPFLEEKEIEKIWNSARHHYTTKVLNNPNYIAPSEYKKRNISYKPKDFTDIGQATVFKQTYGKQIRYSHETGYLFYNGKVWREDSLKVHGLLQKLTDLQLVEARNEFKKVCEQSENEDEIQKEAIKRAEAYRNFVLKYRNSQQTMATLKEVQPMLSIDVKELDRNGFLLNTPSGTIDLRTKELKLHNPNDYCTKITSKEVSQEGEKLFADFLDVITCGDKELEEYLQCVAGMIALGKVYMETLIIAYGGGKNGKSTFFNLLSRVLGDYSGFLSSEVLTIECRKNKSPEIAEIRGKRLVIATELSEGVRLDSALVKKLCSTDAILAEKKYKAPFAFEPSHTLVLYSNYLPNIMELDEGIWRRIVVIPFNAVINSDDEIKNYTEYLYENAGGSVLNWIIEGAYKFIVNGEKIHRPSIVNDAIKLYREENDWLENYISERCVIGQKLSEKSGDLYQDYRKYAISIGEFPKSSRDFSKALEGKGYKKHRTPKIRYTLGLKLRSNDFQEIVDIPFVSMTENDADIQDYSEVEF